MFQDIYKFHNWIEPHQDKLNWDIISYRLIHQSILEKNIHKINWKNFCSDLNDYQIPFLKIF
jgi:hypothetical protein